MSSFLLTIVCILLCVLIIVMYELKKELQKMPQRIYQMIISDLHERVSKLKDEIKTIKDRLEGH